MTPVAAIQNTFQRLRDWLRGDSSAMDRYFFLSWLVVMASGWRWLKCIEYNSWVTSVFTILVFVSYCFIYTLPARLIVWITEAVVAKDKIRLWLTSRKIKPLWLVNASAVFFMATIDVLVFTDYLLYRADGHHVTDTFIINLIFQPGGFGSLGADLETKLTFLGIILGYLALQALLLACVTRWERCHERLQRIITRPRLAILLITIAAMLIWQAVMFGFSRLNGYLPVTDASAAFPLYVPVTFGKLAKKLGYQGIAPHEARIRVHVPKSVTYPLKPIIQSSEHTNYNIIWLVGESLRFDMLDPNIMPHTWRFSQEALNFRHHYSSGNGTRMAMFGMFYGLYANYWWGFLDQERGPVLFDVLLANDYQLCMMTSSNFKYPEFMDTMFAGLPKNVIHEDNPFPEAWQNDRRNVGRLMDFMSERDRRRPFMIFMFFESPHSRYYFPPECAVAKPYLEDFNYTTTDVTKVAPLIRNRYINSCNHLDSQIGRLIDYLKDTGLLESTIVVITGDHGEEFMESGRWGHNSNFSDWQTRVPMILWMPGEKPRAINRMTSHLDLSPTVLKRLGVTNPPEDYCLGVDMLGEKDREFTVVGDWYNIACVDSEYKGIFPIERFRGRQEVTRKDDTSVEDPEDYYQTRRAMLMKIVGQMREFAR